jgi:hypothetical protein
LIVVVRGFGNRGKGAGKARTNHVPSTPYVQ